MFPPAMWSGLKTAGGGCSTPAASPEMPVSATPGPGIESTGRKRPSILCSGQGTGRSSSAATLRPLSGMSTAPCFSTAPHAMKIPTGPLYRVSGPFRLTGRICSVPIILARDLPHATPSAVGAARRKNATQPSPTQP